MSQARWKEKLAWLTGLRDHYLFYSGAVALDACLSLLLCLYVILRGPYVAEVESLFLFYLSLLACHGAIYFASFLYPDVTSEQCAHAMAVLAPMMDYILPTMATLVMIGNLLKLRAARNLHDYGAKEAKIKV